MSEGPAGLVLRLERDGVPWCWALPQGPPGGRGPALPAVPTTDGAVPGVRPWDSGRYAVEEWREGRVVVALAGPPPVMIQIVPKSLKVQIELRTMAITLTGRIIGKVMCRKICQRLAPSMEAASVSSSGMPCRPARNIIAQNGVLAQTTATTTAHSARS